jgi:hypothetical protein
MNTSICSFPKIRTDWVMNPSFHCLKYKRNIEHFYWPCIGDGLLSTFGEFRVCTDIFYGRRLSIHNLDTNAVFLYVTDSNGNYIKFQLVAASSHPTKLIRYSLGKGWSPPHPPHVPIMRVYFDCQNQKNFPIGKRRPESRRWEELLIKIGKLEILLAVAHDLGSF